MFDLYGPLSLSVSTLALGFWLAALHGALVERVHWHDRRSAGELVVVLAGVIAAAGVTVSALSYVVNAGAIGMWGSIGLGLARGGLLAAGLMVAILGRGRR